jgi:large subunit ribosomal protein L25
MAETITFAAERREGSGTGPARALRRAGKIPAIVYGGREEPPLQVALTFKEVRRQVTTNPRFFSSVVELDLGDAGGKIRVLPREAQLHPVTDDPLHVDFMRAQAGALVGVGVPVRFINEQQAPGLKRGGVLNIVRREVELLCPADRIPAEIVADLSGLDINESLHISAVQLPEGVRPTITDRDFTIASIRPPSTEAEEPTPATDADKGADKS